MNNSLSVVHVLDEKVIYDNMEYKNLTKQLAQAFNDMWTKCIKRYTDFLQVLERVLLTLIKINFISDF